MRGSSTAVLGSGVDGYNEGAAIQINRRGYRVGHGRIRWGLGIRGQRSWVRLVGLDSP